MKKLPTTIVACKACGKDMETNQSTLDRGRGMTCSRACNAKKNLLRKNGTRHGLSGTRTYSSWASMMQRCKNPNAPKYYMYGAKGVTICEKWQTFRGFLEDMGIRPKGTTIDRIDGTKGYEKDNCRWADILTQQNNIKSAIVVSYFGEKWTLANLARHLGVKRNTLSYRIASGVHESCWSKKRISPTRPHASEPTPS